MSIYYSLGGEKKSANRGSTIAQYKIRYQYLKHTEDCINLQILEAYQYKMYLWSTLYGRSAKACFHSVKKITEH